MDLTEEEKEEAKQRDVFFRDAFRDARAAAQRDAEGFQEILFALERFGYSLKGAEGNLGEYQPVIGLIAKESALANDIPKDFSQYHLSFSDLYRLVREARNDALHQGAVARYLTQHAVELALIIEDALMGTGEHKTLKSFMVRGVICAEEWQPVSFARQQMLANSFSYLPMWQEDKKRWILLSDNNIAAYLLSDRKKRLAKKLKDAIKDEELRVEPAPRSFLDTNLSDALKRSNQGKPLLVVKRGEPKTLFGIVTAFDLL